ncbi:GEM-like protein 2 [Carya illinoinensis]|nr:GEM-like protein 2 [Carya illinoinensis]
MFIFIFHHRSSLLFGVCRKIALAFVVLFFGFHVRTLDADSSLWTPQKRHINPNNQKGGGDEGRKKNNGKMNDNTRVPVTRTEYFNPINSHHQPNPYFNISPVPTTSSASGVRRPTDTILDTLNRYGKRVDGVTKRAETVAGNFWQHLRTSPSLADAAIARLAQGTRLLADGHDHMFQKAFNVLAGEKLLKSYACYLSTSTGPVIGTLYLSNKRVAFCSDLAMSCFSSTGQSERMYYKIVVQLDQLAAVNPSSNTLNPSEKYIQIITRDGHEFWFMGFISFDKALKNLTKALQQS